MSNTTSNPYATNNYNASQSGGSSGSMNQTSAQQNATANDQGGGNSDSSTLGSLGSWLGTNSNFQADPYQAASDAYNVNANGVTQNQITGYLQGAQGQAANDYGMSNAANAAQSQFMNQANQAMMGNGPSQAQGILQQGNAAANAGAMSLARSASGSNPAAQAAALRNATMQGATNSTNAGAQAAQIKAQEQIAGMNMGANMLNTQRSQDLQQMGQGNQMAGTYFGGLTGQSQAALQAQEAEQALNSSNYNTAMGLNQETSGANASANQSMLSGITSSAGALLAMSDARQKTDMQDESGPNGLSDDANPFTQFAKGYSGKGGNEKHPKESEKLHGGIDPRQMKAALDARAQQQAEGGKPPLDQVMAPSDRGEVYLGESPTLAQVAANPRDGWMADGMNASAPSPQAPVAPVAQPGFGADASPTTFQPQAYNPNFAVTLPGSPPPAVTSDAEAKMDAHAAGMERGAQLGASLAQPQPQMANPGMQAMAGRTGARGNVSQMQGAQPNFRIPTNNAMASAPQQPMGGAPAQAMPAQQSFQPRSELSSIYSDGDLKDAISEGTKGDPTATGGMQMVGDLGQNKPPPSTTSFGPSQMMKGMGGMGGGAGAAAGADAGEDAGMGAAADFMSDERNKDGIGTGDMTEADHFLATLKPYSYRYKDPQNEPRSEPNGGRYLGVMAQNVEQAPDVGRQIVKDTPRGKVLEGGAMMSAMAAGMGRLHERVAQLEQKRLAAGQGVEGK